MNGIGIAGAGLDLVSGIINGIVGKNAHKQYADTLNGIKLTMPDGIKEAESIYGDISGRGLAGKNTIIDDLLASESGAITRAKTVADSPSALLNAIVNLNTNTQSNIRGVDVKDSQVKDLNSGLLARFLSTVKAPAETRIDQFEADKKIAIAKEKLAGTQDLMNGIEGGIGNALGAYGDGAKLGYLNTQTEALKKYWGI